jgi:hypothetical protein
MTIRIVRCSGGGQKELLDAPTSTRCVACRSGAAEAEAGATARGRDVIPAQ